MAKKRTKTAEVKSFGGVEKVGEFIEQGNLTPFHSEMSNKDYLHNNVPWDANAIETQSETHLEDDKGDGQVVVLRHFEFKIDPGELTRFALERGGFPGKQDLFNSVVRFIETQLWKDGLKVFPDQEPRVIVADDYSKYDVFVASIPQKGQQVLDKPMTLTELVHGRH